MKTFSTETTRLSCLIKWSTSTSITTRTTTTMYRTWTGFSWITTWNAIALITNSIWIGRWKTIDKRFARRLNTNDHIYNTEDISRDDKQQKYWWFHVMRAYDRLMMMMIFYIYFDLRQLLLSVLFFPLFSSLSFFVSFILPSSRRMTIWMREENCYSKSYGICHEEHIEKNQLFFCICLFYSSKMDEECTKKLFQWLIKLIKEKKKKKKPITFFFLSRIHLRITIEQWRCFTYKTHLLFIISSRMQLIDLTESIRYERQITQND